MHKRILIVDDEPAIRDMVAFALRKGEFEPVHAGDAREAQVAIADKVPDLILLDWMLPGTSGLELARRWRREALTREIPIIMLTARGEENDRVSGLEAGVDDYVVKPFSARELLARIRAVMRRARGDDEDGSVRSAACASTAPRTACSPATQPVQIGPTEYRLLHFFMTHPSACIRRAQLLDHVWGGNVYVEERTVDVHIRRLRKTLEPHGLDGDGADRARRRLPLFLALALVLGLALGQPWPVLAVAALGVVAWHYWKLRAVLLRLTSRRRLPPPKGVGVWNELDRLLHRGQADMRERKRRLVEMLRAYRAVAAALPDAVVVLERDSQRVQWFNQAATRLLGLRYPDDIESPLGERLRPLPIARWLASGRSAEPILDAPSPLDPGTRLHLRLIPYSDQLWLLVARDVTKLMHLEQVRRDFVANVSHELRTPLTVMHGYLDMLEPGGLPGLGADARRDAHQSQRMTQLVEDLLTLSRLEAQDRLPTRNPSRWRRCWPRCAARPRR
jgi:phosphate regulon transcriptional regulator PhoB